MKIAAILFLIISQSAFSVVLSGSLRAGAPHLANISLGIDLNPKWEFGLQGAPWSPTIAVSEVRLSQNNLDLFSRFYPWEGSFFIGGILGRHHIFAEKSQDITVVLLGSPSAVPVTATGTVSSWYVAPNIGWRFNWESGFFLLFDLGVLIPFGNTTTLEASSSDALGTVFIESIKQTDAYKNLEGQVREKGNQVGSIVLPCFTLVQLGWRFDLESTQLSRAPASKIGRAASQPRMR